MLRVTKETTVAISMSVTVQLLVTRAPNVETQTVTTPAAVWTGFMETVSRAFRVNALIDIVLKTKNAFHKRPQAVNVKTASS